LNHICEEHNFLLKEIHNSSFSTVRDMFFIRFDLTVVYVLYQPNYIDQRNEIFYFFFFFLSFTMFSMENCIKWKLMTHILNAITYIGLLIYTLDIVSSMIVIILYRSFVYLSSSSMMIMFVDRNCVIFEILSCFRFILLLCKINLLNFMLQLRLLMTFNWRLWIDWSTL
jgi:hypothetical protein